MILGLMFEDISLPWLDTGEQISSSVKTLALASPDGPGFDAAVFFPRGIVGNLANTLEINSHPSL